MKCKGFGVELPELPQRGEHVFLGALARHGERAIDVEQDEQVALSLGHSPVMVYHATSLMRLFSEAHTCPEHHHHRQQRRRRRQRDEAEAAEAAAFSKYM